MSDISIAGYWLVLSTLKNYSLVCLNLNHEVEYAANQWTVLQLKKSLRKAVSSLLLLFFRAL